MVYPETFSLSVLVVQVGKEVTFIQKMKYSKNDVNLLKIMTRKRKYFLKAKSHSKAICIHYRKLAQSETSAISEFLVKIKSL